jgi:hypothetical protein
MGLMRPEPVEAKKRPLLLPMVAPTPDAEKTFLPHETEPTEIRGDPFRAPRQGKENSPSPIRRVSPVHERHERANRP